MIMKYVVLQEHKFEHIIAFSKCLNHNDVAAKMNMKPISAGFVDFSGDELRCYGRSETLNMKSRPDADALLILNEFFLE